MTQDHLPGVSEIGDVISISACTKSAIATPDCAHALTARLHTFSRIEKAVQLDGFGKMRLPVSILIIRRGNDCDLIQVVLKAGKEPVNCNKHTQQPTVRYVVLCSFR